MQCVVLVVSLEEAPDTTRVLSQLESLEYWISQMSESNSCADEQIAFVLIGNKADLSTDGS